MWDFWCFGLLWCWAYDVYVRLKLLFGIGLYAIEILANSGSTGWSTEYWIVWLMCELTYVHFNIFVFFFPLILFHGWLAFYFWQSLNELHLVVLEVIIIIVFGCALIRIDILAHLIERSHPRLFVRIQRNRLLNILGVSVKTTSKRRQLQRIIFIIEVSNKSLVVKVIITSFAFIWVHLFGEIRFQFDMAQIGVLFASSPVGLRLPDHRFRLGLGAGLLYAVVSSLSVCHIWGLLFVDCEARVNLRWHLSHHLLVMAEFV